MRALEARLDPETFVRVHRSAIVNADRIAGLERREGGRLDVRLASGRHVRVSGAYVEMIRELAGRRRIPETPAG
jgi:DNA-binding LytR/AlgR family response regulator